MTNNQVYVPKALPNLRMRRVGRDVHGLLQCTVAQSCLISLLASYKKPCGQGFRFTISAIRVFVQWDSFLAGCGRNGCF